MRTLYTIIALLFIGVFCEAALCVEAANTSGETFDYPYKNGLYSTIAGYLSIKEPKVLGERSIDLSIPQTHPPFRKSVPVLAACQNQSAPLVVILLGLDGKAKTPMGRLWLSWFAEAGCHAMTFDSTFTPAFIDISHHGVTGNLETEALRIADIINAFISLPEMRDKVTKIGVVGMSYGSLEALVLGRMGKEGRLPHQLQIARVQAYSSPIRLERTGEIIDRWYDEDRWKYTLIEMALKLRGHKPVASDSQIPFSKSLLRAGISAIFRLGLVDVVERNDAVYDLKLLPRGNEFDDEYVRNEYAALWGYEKYMGDMCAPYWHLTIDELTQHVSLVELLRHQPPTTEEILSADDPFNAPEDLTELKSSKFPCSLTILPCGGHLGFADHPWIKKKLLSIFNSTEPSPIICQLNSAPAEKLPMATTDEIPRKPMSNTDNDAERRDVIASLVPFLRTDNFKTVKQALELARNYGKVLFAEMDWPEMVAETALQSNGEIQMLLLKYLEECSGQVTPESRAHILGMLAKLLESQDRPVANEALAIFTKYGTGFQLDLSSPKRCFISWLMIYPSAHGSSKAVAIAKRGALRTIGQKGSGTSI